MTDLAAWLLEQIAQDERRVHDEDIGAPHITMCGGWSAGNDTFYEENCNCGWGDARVLVECEAKRRIVEQWTRIATRLTVDIEQTQGWDTLCLLALPYADRPGYRAEWTPAT